MFLLKPFGALLDRIICVVFAVLLSQGPTYMEQYIDVLSGATTEAKINYDEVGKMSFEQNKTPEVYLKDLILQAPEGSDLRNLLEIQYRGVDRYISYNQALTALKEATIWNRPFVFFKHFDETLHDAMSFEPNIPMTLEGGAYALIGIIIGLLVMALLRFLWNMIDFGTSKKPTKG